MLSIIIFSILGVTNYFSYKEHERNGDRNWANFSWFNIGLCSIMAFEALVKMLNSF